MTGFNCSLFPDNPNNCEAIIDIRLSIGLVSMTGCVFVLVIMWIFKKYQFFVQRLIIALTVASLMDSFAYAMGRVHTEPEPVCIFQAIWMQFFDWAVLMWVCCIAFNLFWNVIKLKRTDHFEKWYHLISWGVALIMTLIPLKNYGPAGAWCWIEEGQNALRFGTYYGPLFAIIGVLFIVYTYIIVTVNRQVRSWPGTYNPETERHKALFKEAIRPLKAYPFIYLLLSIFPLVNRIQNAVNGDQDAIFPLWLLHAISSPLQGLLNSIAFALDKETASRLNITQIRIALQGRTSRRLVREYPTNTGSTQLEANSDSDEA